MRKNNRIKLGLSTAALVFLTAQSSHSAERLETITVTEKLPSTPKVSGGFVLDEDTLKHTPGTGGDPIRVLQSLPGIVVNDDTSAAPAIRGSRPQDNSYFVDFLPAGYLFHFGGGVSVFNEHLVKSFALYPSAYSAPFEGGAGAVIDVELRDPGNEKVTTTLDISFLKAGALIEGPVTENQSFYLAGRFSYLDLLLEDLIVDEDDGVEFLQFPKFSDYQGKYLWKLDDGSSLTFQVNGASDKTQFNLSGKDDDVRNEPDLIGEHSESVSFNSQGLVWKKPLESGSDLTLALGHMVTESKDKAGSVLDGESTFDNVFVKGRWNKMIGMDHQITLGGTLTQIDADYDIDFKDPGCTEFEVDCSVTDAQALSSTDSFKANVTNLFVEDSWFVNDQLTLIPGLAYTTEDYLDQSFLEPRLRGEYAYGNDWVFSAGAGRYHQFPGFLVSEKVFGNPDLNHSASTHYVVGAERDYHNGWTWKSEVYHKQFEDLVTANPLTRFSNTGEGVATGLELLARKALTDQWSGWLSLSASESKRTNTLTGQSFDFEYDQPFIATLVSEYKLNKKWRFGLKWWFHSGAPDTPIVGGMEDPDAPGRFIPVYGAINSERLPDYHRLDLRVDRQFGFKRTDMSGYVELINAYGQKNVVGYDYNDDFSNREAIHQLPSIISFGLKVKF